MKKIISRIVLLAVWLACLGLTTPASAAQGPDLLTLILQQLTALQNHFNAIQTQVNAIDTKVNTIQTKFDGMPPTWDQILPSAEHLYSCHGRRWSPRQRDGTCVGEIAQDGYFELGKREKCLQLSNDGCAFGVADAHASGAGKPALGPIAVVQPFQRPPLSECAIDTGRLLVGYKR